MDEAEYTVCRDIGVQTDFETATVTSPGGQFEEMRLDYVPSKVIEAYVSLQDAPQAKQEIGKKRKYASRANIREKAVQEEDGTNMYLAKMCFFAVELLDCQATCQSHEWPYEDAAHLAYSFYKYHNKGRRLFPINLLEIIDVALMALKRPIGLTWDSYGHYLYSRLFELAHEIVNTFLFNF